MHQTKLIMAYISKRNRERISELSEIIKTYGYWSKEVLEYNNSMEHGLMMKINNTIEIGTLKRSHGFGNLEKTN